MNVKKLFGINLLLLALLFWCAGSAQAGWFDFNLPDLFGNNSPQAADASNPTSGWNLPWQGVEINLSGLTQGSLGNSGFPPILERLFDFAKDYFLNEVLPKYLGPGPVVSGLNTPLPLAGLGTSETSGAAPVVTPQAPPIMPSTPEIQPTATLAPILPTAAPQAPNVPKQLGNFSIGRGIFGSAIEVTYQGERTWQFTYSLPLVIASIGEFKNLVEVNGSKNGFLVTETAPGVAKVGIQKGDLITSIQIAGKEYLPIFLEMYNQKASTDTLIALLRDISASMHSGSSIVLTLIRNGNQITNTYILQ